MRRSQATAALAFLLVNTSFAANDPAPWRPTWTVGRLTTTLTGNFAYDTNHATSGSTLDPHSQAFRRREVGFRVAAPGAWDAFVYYDAQARRWFDVTWRVQSSWLFGRDIGTWRVGHSRVPFGFETITASRHRSFIEFALPWQAFFQNRRTGIDWAWHRQHAIVEIGYYFAGDLQGDNDGRTLAAHGAWVPIHEERHVLHVGGSISVENPAAWTDGLGQRKRPAARWRARPEAGLTEIRLVDTGAITGTRRITRKGLEAVLIEGPWSVQAEYVDVGVSRAGGTPVNTHGYYVFASLVLTGESRRYARGQVTDVIPRRSGGAVEVLARHSAVDLNNGNISGGRQRALTFGINWYLGRHLKFQYNHVRTEANRQRHQMNLAINELQAQVHF
jgi:phosphate-selective porin OprO and OprP